MPYQFVLYRERRCKMENPLEMYSVSDFLQWLDNQDENRVFQMNSQSDCPLAAFTREKCDGSLWFDGDISDYEITLDMGEDKYQLPEWCTMLMENIYRDHPEEYDDFPLSVHRVKEYIAQVRV